RLLGWQVYDQEVLEYMAQDQASLAGAFDDLPDPVRGWAEGRLRALEREHGLGPSSALYPLARVVLALGAQGGGVFIGRGAGCPLPPRTTLNVRVVAPLNDRIAYMGQWLRLGEEDAAERVRTKDERRAEFLTAHFHRHPDDVHQYDLVLNSSSLGEDAV